MATCMTCKTIAQDVRNVGEGSGCCAATLPITDTIETDRDITHLGTGVFDNGDGTVDMIRLAVIANGELRSHAPSLITVPKREIVAMTKG